jgi:hypothetical protein
LGEKSDGPDNNAHKKRKKETAMWQTKSVLARIRKEQEKEREREEKKEKKKRRLVREAQTSSADAAYQDPKRIREGEKTKTTTRQKQNRKKRRLVIEAQNQKKFRKRKIQQRKGTEESRLRTPPRQSQKSQQQQLDIARILRRKDRKKGGKNNEKARQNRDSERKNETYASGSITNRRKQTTEIVHTWINFQDDEEASSIETQTKVEETERQATVCWCALPTHTNKETIYFRGKKKKKKTTTTTTTRRSLQETRMANRCHNRIRKIGSIESSEEGGRG